MKNHPEKIEDNLDDSVVYWKRIAEPQSDQYDSIITLQFARKYGYLCREIGSEPTFFDGKVTIRNDSTLLLPYIIPALHDHPNITRGCDLIRLWPTVFIQCQLLIESISPFIDTQNLSNLIVGSTCGDGGGFGRIATTVNNHVGFAEAIVHEMAHHKLRALGVEYESAERIIKNTPEQKYKSPIRYDCLRPMPAILHAQYSYTYVSALDIEIIRAGQEPERDRLIAEGSLAVNLPKLEFGYKVIKDNAEVDSAGADFLEGLFNWLNHVLENGYKILGKLQIPPKTFVHPLDAHDNHRQPMNMLDHSHIRPCRLSGVEEYSLGDEMLLYFSEKETGFSLNSSSKAIWELCDGNYTLIEIGEELGKRFGFSDNELLLNELLSDAIAAINQLHELGVIELGEAPCVKST